MIRPSNRHIISCQYSCQQALNSVGDYIYYVPGKDAPLNQEIKRIFTRKDVTQAVIKLGDAVINMGRDFFSAVYTVWSI